MADQEGPAPQPAAARGEKDECLKPTGSWATWVNPTGLAVGIFSKGCFLATCHPISGPAACSDVAPLQIFALTPGLPFEYKTCLNVRTVEELRDRFLRVSREENTDPEVYLHWANEEFKRAFPTNFVFLSP